MLSVAILSCALGIAAGTPATPGIAGAPSAQGALGAQGPASAPGAGATGPAGAQGATSAPGAGATNEAGRWRIDVGGAALREAWDFNQSTESLAGAVLGVERRLWRGLSVRAELLALRVMQHDEDGWLRGVLVGTRLRSGQRRVGFTPVVDVAVGLSRATRPVPPEGTSFNYLAAIGAGLEMPLRPAVVTVTGRWFHASNNGREGRHRNPDIQSLGVVLSVGWEY